MFPAIDVNDAEMKHLFDNRYGTGQSTLDGIFSATNLLVAGRVCVVAGYGWCGKGVAARLRGMGGEVFVTEVDPVQAIEARLDGFRVVPMLDAAPEADLIVTVTGQHRGGSGGALPGAEGRMRSRELRATSTSRSRGPTSKAWPSAHRPVRPHVEEYRFADGRRAYLLGEGRLINLAAGQGHPVEIMDLSFALQALSAEHLVQHGRTMEARVHPVPPALDRSVAEAALAPLGVGLDHLTEEQVTYLNQWEGGT